MSKGVCMLGDTAKGDNPPVPTHPNTCLAMAAGFPWNPEDADPANTLVLTEGQWATLARVGGNLEAAGFKQHALFDLITLLRRFAFWCDEQNLLFLSLTGTTFTNFAATRTTEGDDTEDARNATLRQAHRLAAAAATAVATTKAQSRLRANSGRFWPDDAAAEAAALGLPPPTATERCVHTRTTRPVKAGEELVEDYNKYDCPWAGYKP